MHTQFWWGNAREGDTLNDIGVNGSKILKEIIKKWDGGVDWINLAQDRDKWRVRVNAAMNLLVL